MAEDLATPSNSLVKVRWKEPYVSEGLNKKLNGLIPRGVIRGGRLTTSVLNSHVVVEADPDTNDSVYSFIDANGHQLTFRQQGDVALDLNIGVLPGTTAYVGLEIVYTTSAATSVKWRGFTAVEVAADPTLVILGSVDVPGVAALIPASDIYYDVRDDAGINLSPGMRDWRQVIDNPSFEGKATNIDDDATESRDFQHYVMRNLGNDGAWSVLSPGSGPASQPRTGSNNLIADGQGVGTYTMICETTTIVRVLPGQAVRASVWVRGDIVALGAGAGASVGINLAFYDWDGNLITTTAFTEDGTVITGTFDYFEIKGQVKAPANASQMRMRLTVNDTTSFTGDIGFDDFHVWLEPGRVASPYDNLTDVMKEIVTDGLVVVPSYDVGGTLDPSDLVQRALRLLGDNGSGIPEHKWGMVSDSYIRWIMRLPKGILDVGEERVDSASSASYERFKSHYYGVDGYYTLLFELQNSTGARGNIRIYLAHGSPASNNQQVISFVFNAKWNSTLNAGAGGWERDVFSSSYRMDIGGSGDLYYYGYSQTDPDGWGDSDWDGPGLEAFRLDTNLSAGEADLYLPGGVGKDTDYRFRSVRYGNYLYFNGSALLPTTEITAPVNPLWARSWNTEAYPKVSSGSALMLDLGAHLKDGDYIDDMWIWSEIASGTTFDWELREIEFHDPAASPTDSLIDSGTLTGGVGHHLDKYTPGYWYDKGWGTLMLIPYLLIWAPLTLGDLSSIHAVAFRYDTQKVYV